MNGTSVYLTSVHLTDNVNERQVERRRWICDLITNVISEALEKCDDEIVLVTLAGKRRKAQKREKHNKSTHFLKEKSPLPNVPNKYYAQRYRFWSLYDEGIKMDTEGWYSVTPEVISKHIADRVSGKVIIDAFTGCGSNAVHFAAKGYFVIAIDINQSRIEMAKHNAKLYGVEDRIDFIVADAMDILPQINHMADVVFLSPPWGGPEYTRSASFNVETDLEAPLNGVQVFKSALLAAPNIVYYLPRTVDVTVLSGLAEAEGVPCIELESHYLQHDKLKSKAAYIGPALAPPAEVSRRGVELQKQGPGDVFQYATKENAIYEGWIGDLVKSTQQKPRAANHRANQSIYL